MHTLLALSCACIPGFMMMCMLRGLHIEWCMLRTCSYNKAARISKELAERKAQLESEAYQAWLKAREANDWGVFAPKLEELVSLTAEVAAAVDPDKSVYDSALDNFEKGFTSARIDEIFEELKAGVVPLIAELKERGTRPDDAWLQGEWDTKQQAALCDSVVKELGFDTGKGRLDVSVHPFTWCALAAIAVLRPTWHLLRTCSVASCLCSEPVWHSSHLSMQAQCNVPAGWWCSPWCACHAARQQGCCHAAGCTQLMFA